MFEVEIFAAVKADNLVNLKRLIAMRANVNAIDGDGSTPLMYARSIETTNLLLSAGADPLIHNNEGWSALDSAYESNNLAAQKILVIAEVKKLRLIEVKIDDNEETIRYKLITTLLYESSRHEWEDLWMLQKRIGILHPPYAAYDKSQFLKVLEAAETAKKTFFGSYLSDDSDSEEEQQYTIKTQAQKQQTLKNAEALRHRAQVIKIRYKNNYAQHKSGDLKLSGEPASSLFNFSDRIQIPRDLPPENVKNDLDQLNGVFKKYADDPEKIQKEIAKIPTKFVVAQYRGITYLTTKWNKPARQLHRNENEIGKPVYSHSVYAQMGVPTFSELAQKKANLGNFEELADKIAEQVKQILLSFRVEAGASYHQYAFNSLADLLQQAYSSNYHQFHQLIKEDPNLKELLLNHANPFLSTGDIPYHAAKYAYGMKPYEGHEGERLRPRWQENGKAERPYSGKLYASLHPITDYANAGPTHLISLVWQGRVQIDNLIIAERESSFLGYIPKNRVVMQMKAKYPSFRGNYKNIYLHKYGIDRELYLKFQAEFRNAPPHSPKNKLLKKLLGEWLCSYAEVKMINLMQEIASQRGEVLVYRNEQGVFSFTPPTDSPTRNGVEEKRKSPVIQQRGLRRQASSPDNTRIISVGLPDKIYSETINFSSDEYYIDEYKNEAKNSIQMIFLHAVKNHLTEALKHFLTKPNIAQTVNHVFTNLYRLETATLLHIAAGLNYVDIIELLLPLVDVNVPVDEKPQDRWHDDHPFLYLENLTPVLYAIVHNNREALSALLKSPKVNKTALAHGVYNKDRLDDAFITWDDEAGVIGQFNIGMECFNVTKIKNWSALHLAVLFADVEILKMLIDYGINPNLKGTDGWTAYDIAIDLKKTAHAELLNPAQPELLLPSMDRLSIKEAASTSAGIVGFFKGQPKPTVQTPVPIKPLILHPNRP